MTGGVAWIPVFTGMTTVKAGTGMTARSVTMLIFGFELACDLTI
jgi:hypothetical protein